MKRILTLFLLLSSIGVFAQTNVGGVISGNVTWTAAGNPYTVTANTLVQFASTLTIMPGVQINFNQGLYLQVDGTLRVEGNSSSQVVFQASSLATSWGGIRFTDMAMNYDSASNTGNRISYAVISGMDNWTNSIYIDSCWVRVHKTEIIGSQCGISAHTSSSFLDSNLIYNAGLGIGCGDDATNVYSPYNIIRGNVVHDCGSGMGAMRGIMEGNHVYNVVDGVGIVNDWLFTYPPIFINNVIENCSGVGLSLSEMSEAGIYRGNVFRNNNIHLQISCDPKCLVECNRFMNQTGQYKVYGIPTTWSATCPAPGSGSYYTIDLSSNNWDGMSLTGLDSVTHDFNDNFAVGLYMLYAPMLSDTDACLSPVPPSLSGIVESVNQNSVSVFPNPISTSATISIANGIVLNDAMFALCNVTGESVMQIDNINSNSVVFDRKNLSAGVYFYRLMNEGIMIGSGKIVIE